MERGKQPRDSFRQGSTLGTAARQIDARIACGHCKQASFGAFLADDADKNLLSYWHVVTQLEAWHAKRCWTRALLPISLTRLYIPVYASQSIKPPRT